MTKDLFFFFNYELVRRFILIRQQKVCEEEKRSDFYHISAADVRGPCRRVRAPSDQRPHSPQSTQTLVNKSSKCGIDNIVSKHTINLRDRMQIMAKE